MRTHLSNAGRLPNSWAKGSNSLFGFTKSTYTTGLWCSSLESKSTRTLLDYLQGHTCFSSSYHPQDCQSTPCKKPMNMFRRLTANKSWRCENFRTHCKIPRHKKSQNIQPPEAETYCTELSGIHKLVFQSTWGPWRRPKINSTISIHLQIRKWHLVETQDLLLWDCLLLPKLLH